MAENPISNSGDLMTLEQIIHSNEQLRLSDFFEHLLPGELAREFNMLAWEDQIHLLDLLGPEKSAELISKMSGLGAAAIVERLPSPQSVQILKEMPRDQQVRLLRKIGEENAEAILEKIKPQKVKKIRKLMRYAENTAGAMMITDYLAYDSHQMVGDVLYRLSY